MRRYVHDFIAHATTPAAQNAAMLSAFGLPAAHVLKLAAIADDIARGRPLDRGHVATLAAIYPGVPPHEVLDAARALNATAGSPAFKVRQFMFLLGGADAIAPGIAAHHEIARNSAVQAIDRKHHAADERTRAQMAARAAKLPALERTQQADAARRRELIAMQLGVNPQHQPLDGFKHADRMEAAAHVLFGREPAPLRDTLNAAYDSHSAVEYGKEVGVFNEAEGIATATEGVAIGSRGDWPGE